MALTLDSLRTRILSALSGQLGTYTWKNAAGSNIGSATAVRIVGVGFPTVNGEVWAEDPAVIDGLEAVITPEVTTDYQSRLNGDYELSHETQVILKQWDVTSTVLAARGLFIKEFSTELDTGAVGPRLIRNSVLDSVESITFTFQIPALS